MSFHISHLYKSPNWDARDAAIDSIVVHSCEGKPHGNEQTSSIPWLCKPGSKVSCHYYVTREGVIYQLVSDAHRAWHAGPCTLAKDTNSCSIGIELEHALGSAPYPEIQRDALTWLCRSLMATYAIPLDRVVSHRATALPAKRKQDPTDWNELTFRVWVASLCVPPASPTYSESSPILGMSPRSAGEVYAALAHRFPVRSNDPNLYTKADVCDILEWYWRLCIPVGVNPLLAVSQMLHETAYLVSFWSIRDQRNPAGIGITGTHSHVKPPNTDGWKYNTQRQQWEVGLSFKNWQFHSIPAHVGRLLAYVLQPNEGTPAQRELIDRALSYRPLPLRTQGSAQVLKQLGKVHNSSGQGWASPGLDYGSRIAAIANTFLEPA